MDAIVTEYMAAPNSTTIVALSIKYNRTCRSIVALLSRAGEYKPKPYVCGCVCRYCKSKFSLTLIECKNCGAPIKDY